ncbi:MAG: hypothetical protein Q8L87_20950, partial [Anaerolineales bacterium]|nr:hypothetical protein [Anaerolineales bacterium]
MIKAQFQAQKRGAGAPAGGGAPLPCLNRNNSNEGALNRLTNGHRKTAFALTHNVLAMAERFGIEKLGFLTLTFAEHITEVSEAQKRYNSLRAGVLAVRYSDNITVLERMKSDRIHFHLLVALPDDIRTGFDFEAVEREDYRSANAKLRAEWAFWRKTAKDYGFGRTELMPVKSTGEGIAKYVGKYIAKHIDQRKEADKGARLVRYSRTARKCGVRFSWNSPGAWLWRAKLAQFARKHGVDGLEGMKERFGASWAYFYGPIIEREVLNHYPTAAHAIADGRMTADELEGKDPAEVGPVKITSSHDEDRQELHAQRVAGWAVRASAIRSMT